MRVSLIVVFVLLVVAGCDTTTPSTQGEQVQYNELNSSPGFAWFQSEVATYTPNAQMVQQVATSFDTTSQKVCIFVRPSCGCRGTQKLFPRTVKTLLSANIDLSRIEIWSMRQPTDATPYSSKLSLTALPTIVVMKGGAESARFTDHEYTEQNADSLIAEAIRK